MVEAVPGRRYRAGRHGHSLSGGHHFDVEKRASRCCHATVQHAGPERAIGSVAGKGSVGGEKKWQLGIIDASMDSICWYSLDGRDIQRNRDRPAGY